MVDKYEDLRELKILLNEQKGIQNLKEIIREDDFCRLKPSTKFKMARMQLITLVDFKKSRIESCLSFLDRLFKYEA